jgi:hypothetical protein
MKYEKPRLLDLSEEMLTDGATCNSGSNANTICAPGNGASGGGSGCNTGPTGASCTGGTTPVGRCSTGTGAGVLCTLGSSG